MRAFGGRVLEASRQEVLAVATWPRFGARIHNTSSGFKGNIAVTVVPFESPDSPSMTADSE
jgi:hypothetical protein